jgi:hypothetical protein
MGLEYKMLKITPKAKDSDVECVHMIDWHSWTHFTPTPDTVRPSTPEAQEIRLPFRV